MKHSFKLSRKVMLGAFVLSTIFMGCQNSDNDIFDVDPIVRLDNIAKTELKNKLVDSEYGWVVSFSPDGNKFLGGFNMWLEFSDDNSVLIRTDQYLDDLSIEKSEFNFVKLNTIALSFPLGNKIHDFTAMQPKELRTDIEFLLSEYVGEDVIEFVGQISKQKIYFRKATLEEKEFELDRSWNLYDKINQMTKCTITVGGRSTSYRWNNIPAYRSAQIGSSSTGYLNNSKYGVVTFNASEDGSYIEAIPAMELSDGSTVSEMYLQGNKFVGTSETNATVTFTL